MNKGLQTFIGDIRKYVGEPKCILDIGSRDGGESLDLAREFPNAEIHAFEPSAENYKLCEKALDGSRVKLWKLALADYEGVADFYYTVGNIGASSLARPLNVPWTADQRTIIEQVQVISLDEWCAANAVEPDVLWIDVQGQELAVFQGGRKSLGSVRAIYTEAGLVPYYEKHSLRNEIVGELTNFQGFTLIRDEKDWEKETNLTFIK
jgi:FkbM family methyltransferase